MEEVSGFPEESQAKKQGWVKFDEDQKEVSSSSSGEPAVLPVENGPKTTSKNSSESGAVIETTQVHVQLEKRKVIPTPSETNIPSPAPRVTKENTPPGQHSPPKAAARSRSTPAEKASRGNRSADTVIQMSAAQPTTPQAAAATASATVQSKRGPELHNVSLAEATNNTNGSVSTSIHELRRATARQAFANGDVIATLHPLNTRCPWVTRAEFRPEYVPEELMSQHLTLTIEEYLSAMEVLVNDFRFNCYNICYKRILLAWIVLGFIVLLAILFSGVKGIILFGAGVIWLFLNATGIFVCMWVKIKLRYHLEHCLAQVNKYFIKHKILLGVDDRGKLSCHKVNLIFVYFDCTDCVKKLNEVIEHEDKPKQEGPSRTKQSFQDRMDLNESDIIITGSSTNTRLPRQQERGERLLLRYSQRWVKDFVCNRLDLCVDVHERQEGEPPAQPRHCVNARCPCQFIEEHLHYKPRGKICGCHMFDF